MATSRDIAGDTSSFSLNGDGQPPGAVTVARSGGDKHDHRLIRAVNAWMSGRHFGDSAEDLPDERTLAYTRYDRPAREGASFDQMFSALYEGRGWMRGVEAAHARYYYPLLQDAFERTHGKIVHRFFADRIAAGAVLTENAEFFVAFWWNGFLFDTCSARAALARILDLRDEAQRYLQDNSGRNPDEASDRQVVFLEKLFTTATDLVVVVRNERDRHSTQRRDDEPNSPSAQYSADIAQITRRLDALKAELESQASQPAYIRYSLGVLLGLIVISAVVATTALSGTRGVALGVTIAGAVGSFVSVSLRLSSGAPIVDYRAEHRTQYLFGLLRPLVGCAFAWAVYAIVAGGLASYIKAPADETTRTLFYAALAFVSGFSERFAQDVIVKTAGLAKSTT